MSAPPAGLPAWLAEVWRFLTLLWWPGEVREVRIPRHNRFGHTAAGWFDDPEALLRAIVRWDGRANLFLTINAVNPALLARAHNRILDRVESTTADLDITHRSVLLVDIDARRPSGISSTEAERRAAAAVCDAVAAYLAAAGWPDPLRVMSGNGYYLIYGVALANTAEVTALIHAVLVALAARFDTPAAHIDPSVANAARIAGLVGTLKVKGDPLLDRPHRRSCIESAPDRLFPVSEARLRVLAGTISTPSSAAGGARGPHPHLVDLLRQHGIAYREQPVDANGITWYHVEQCCFHDDGRPYECGVGQQLPDGPYAGHCFHPEGQGKGWRDWKLALGLIATRAAAPAAAPSTAHHRPEILVSNRHLHAIVADAWAAVQAANDPPWLFNHGGGIAELARVDGTPVGVTMLSLAALRGRIDRAAVWTRLVDGHQRPARPPKDVVEDMLALDNPLPILRGITGTPVFAVDRTLVLTPGYQPATRRYYAPVGRPVPAIPARPTDADLAWARTLLVDEWLVDFPFSDSASRANTVAAVLTVILREQIDGPTPLFAVDGAAPGVGKGLLVDTIALTVTGASASVMSDTANEDEVRKRITALLRELAPVIVLDNINRRLASGTLSAVLTATVWKDRLLGRNETITLPNHSLWLATGNNLDLDLELTRRSPWIRLAAQSSRPWERGPEQFRHHPLGAWVRAQRHLLVRALLVFAQRWLAEGRPAWTGTPIGSYEAWSAVVGGVLSVAGIPGFLANREQQYQRSDSESEEWRAFVGAWWDSYAERPVRVSALHALLERRELLPSLFSVAMANTERGARTRLGMLLRQRIDRRYSNSIIRSLGIDPHEKVTLYALEPAADGQDHDGAP